METKHTKSSRKLSLSKETLRRLDTEELGMVAGGSRVASCACPISYLCTMVTCGATLTAACTGVCPTVGC